MKPERKKRSRDEEHSGDARDRQAQEIERLKQENERLRKELAEREKKIADLERQLALRQQNSTTTSKPPSSDGPRAAREESAYGRRSAWPSRAPSCARSHRMRGYDRRSGARHVSPVCAPLVRAAQRWRRVASSSHGVASDRGAHHGVPMSSPTVSRVRDDDGRAAAR